MIVTLLTLSILVLTVVLTEQTVHEVEASRELFDDEITDLSPTEIPMDLEELIGWEPLQSGGDEPSPS